MIMMIYAAMLIMVILTVVAGCWLLWEVRESSRIDRGWRRIWREEAARRRLLGLPPRKG